MWRSGVGKGGGALEPDAAPPRRTGRFGAFAAAGSLTVAAVTALVAGVLPRPRVPVSDAVAVTAIAAALLGFALLLGLVVVASDRCTRNAERLLAVLLGRRLPDLLPPGAAGERPDPPLPADPLDSGRRRRRMVKADSEP